MSRVGIIGAGSWGTALSLVLAITDILLKYGQSWRARLRCLKKSMSILISFLG